MPLAPDNQAERQHIVEEPHDKKGPPDSRITGQAFAAPSQDQQQNHRGNRNPADNNGKNRKFTDSDAVEQERAGPDKRQCQQQDPFHRPHLPIDGRGCRHPACGRLPRISARPARCCPSSSKLAGSSHCSNAARAAGHSPSRIENQAVSRLRPFETVA